MPQQDNHLYRKMPTFDEMSANPNILLILSDQQRYDCIGYSGNYPVNTPNTDRLAAEGIWFTNAFTPIPVCCPARQSMLAGKRPEAFGALWNYNNGLRVSALEPSHYNWVKDLSEHGYNTGHIGKWSINPEYTPREFGFKEYVSDKEYEVFRREKYPEIKYYNGFFGENDPTPLEDARTHWLAGKAVQMIKDYSRKDAPWAVCLDFPEPHLPCRPSDHFAYMYRPEHIPVWRNFEDSFIDKPYIQRQQLYSWNIENYTWEDWAPIVARYYGVVSQVDDAIGRVLNALDELGISDNTVVIYSSDHGDMCGSHRMMDKHYVLYDDIVRVPLAIRWPGRVKAGLKCSEFICHSLDLPPTILEIAGIGIRDFFQGRSLLPFMKGESVHDWRKEVVSTYNGQQFGLYTQRMIRDKKWKYIWNTTDVDELYNLEEDPGELLNLVKDEKNSGLLVELRRRLYEELVKDGDGLVCGNPWMKNQLCQDKKIL